MENKSYIDGSIITISKVPEKEFLTEEEVAWEIEQLCRTVGGEGGGEGWISESWLVHILHDDIKESLPSKPSNQSWNNRPGRLLKFLLKGGALIGRGVLNRGKKKRMLIIFFLERP